METKINSEALNLLQKASDAETALFTRFELLTSMYDVNVLYCFIEGYDMPYYISRVREISGLEPKPIECKGKKNVIKIFDFLNKKPIYKKYKQLFFVDRDFDDNTKLSVCDIYITPCYSIENLYVSENCISRILSIEYKLLPKDDGKYESALDLYKNELNKFHNAVLLFNAWYACLKSKLLENEQSISLEDKFPVGFIHLEINNITCNYTINEINANFPIKHIITDEELETKKAELSQNSILNLRGKYEIQFLGIFLEFLNKDSRGEKIYTKSKSSTNINVKQLISQFSQYADTPACLRAYIISKK